MSFKIKSYPTFFMENNCIDTTADHDVYLNVKTNKHYIHCRDKNGCSKQEDIGCMVEVQLEGPLFEHDCTECVFLGRHPEIPVDLYFCKQGGSYPTVIARRGNKGADYTSGLVFAVMEPLKIAKRLAEERGLL